MMQELVTLFRSDIVRLLGALGLVSLGITLTLWGLKRRRSGAVLIALLLCLVALVPTVLADHLEIPPPGSVAQIQTSGLDTPLNIGDWYTSRNPDAGGPGYHAFNIVVPCTIAPTEVITVQLFDPGVWHDGSADELDEVRDNTAAHNKPDPPDNTYADDATFTLFDPTGAPIISRTYTPTVTTSGVTATLTSFSVGTYGCGVYTLHAATSGDDDNAWKLRVVPDDFDGTPGTGDEINLGNLQTSFQNVSLGCQTFHFLVPAEVPSIRLSNFDMDVPGLCTSPTCTIAYITPSGTVISGTESAGTEWNNGGGTGYPPPGGDEILDPEPGWWQAELCLNDDNQYIFDTGGLTYFYYRPPTPDMSVGKDDGTGTFSPDGVLTYTIIYTNAGPGAALDAMLTDTLPLSTTFVSCSGGLSCGYVPPPPGSGIVVFQLGTIISETSGIVTVSVRVDAGAPTGTLTNTVELDYSDVLFSDYPPETDIDVDQYEANAAIEIAKTVYLGHDGGASCPGGESVTGANGTDVTYCFRVTNTGTTYLDSITINDPDLGITEADMTPLSGSSPLAPGESLVYYYETVINGDLDNRASTSGNPTDADGIELPGLDDPTDDDTAAVLIRRPQPEREREESSEAPPPAPTAVVPPTPVPPTPTVEVVTVARLPETGGFPGWFTVVLGVPLIIGAAGLLNLAVLEMRARRGDGKWD
jgi:uncharacterized repeat protein (TIGR01451 family)